MEAEIRKLADEWAALEKAFEESPRTEEDSKRLRASLRTSWKPRLAHHLMKIQNGKSPESFRWVLNYFDEQHAEVKRLRRYQHNVRKAMKALQAAYEGKLRLLAAATSDIASPRELVMTILSELGIKRNPPPIEKPVQTQSRYA